MRDSFVFYRSFAEACRELNPEDFKAAVLAMCDYAMDDKDPDTDGVAKAILIMAKPVIDSNNQKYKNGTKGGRPKNQTETKPKPNNNQTETKAEPYVDVEEDVEVNVEVEEKETPKGVKKEPKHKHGKSVLLTDSEYEKLKDEYGEAETEKAIAYFNDYIGDKGYKSKSHYLAMRRWVFTAVKENDQRKERLEGKARSGTTNKFNAFEQRQNNYDDIEARMMRRRAAQ